MTVSRSESYLESLANRTFLGLWTISNPYKTPGDEMSDILVVFGNEVVIFSDKACAFDGADIRIGWQRWYKNAVKKSVAQLAGAARRLKTPDTPIFLDSKATQPLPLDIPALPEQRLHLVAIARPDHEPGVRPAGWRELSLGQDGKPFEIGRLEAGGRFVHVFDGDAIETILAQLDTVSDFLGYLIQREQALTARREVVAREVDLLALATESWRVGKGYAIDLPPPDGDGVTRARQVDWKAFNSSSRSERTRKLNHASRLIDRIIDHQHQEYVAQRIYHTPLPRFSSHERALRLLASESRLGRRIIVSPLYDDILQREEKHCLISTIPSSENPALRYVWLTYPYDDERKDLDTYEQSLIRYLKDLVIAMREQFSEELVLGIGLSNLVSNATSCIMVLLDGTEWSPGQRRTAYLREIGALGELEEETKRHIR